MKSHPPLHSPIPGFARCEDVSGRYSIADFFAPTERCGIYILHFTDGWFYVGQALDVTRRFVQHRKTHRDMERISFKPVAADALNQEERNAIRSMEDAGFQLRNIALVTMPSGDTDFDLLMPRAEQEQWLAGGAFAEPPEDRLTDAALRIKYRAKYQQFCTLPASPAAIAVLQAYVQACIPAYLSGEQSFWSCSCLPGRQQTGVEVLARVNLNWQEVFCLFLSNGQLQGRLQLARSPLGGGLGWTIVTAKLRIRYRATLDLTHKYAPGGEDQCAVTAPGESLLRLFREPRILTAARLFNLRLCRKGPNQFSRYHCLDLADEIIRREKGYV